MENWLSLLQSAMLTIQLATLSYIGALVFGTLAAAARVSVIRPLVNISAMYVQIGRNAPALALLFLVVYGLPEIGITFGLFWSVVLVFAAYEGVFVCESLRAGINAVPRGNAEAARALGMDSVLVISTIIIPQAARNVVQPLGSSFIKVTLGTSIAAVVGMVEMTGAAERIYLREGNPAVFIVIAGIYASLALLIGYATGRIERKVRFVR